ncbi:sialate O-acetylesterase [Bradyrhizobium betae]|uniref:sialate O-acetylesterase n=1 Tax=Bradyrhizobium betae TaxID=244734 RepID=UPI0013871EA0|nr:sialate O-acetylesterase [Bradyrhizobium betae]MCS3725957.1 hypothetical protein [Bradyrhizobium betae]
MIALELTTPASIAKKHIAITATADAIGCGKSPLGPGNICGHLGDLLLATFDRVIFAPVAIGSTSIERWSTGDMSRLIPVAIKKLALRGVTPATPGVTMAMLWMQGENDGAFGTTQAAYQAAFGTIVTNALAAGFAGRVFICKETWASGNVSATIQAAQTAAIDNVQVFFGGNLDRFGAAYRQVDNTHPNDLGGAAFAAEIVTAMHASGGPF